MTPTSSPLGPAGDLDVSVLARPSLLGGRADQHEPWWVDRARGAYLWDQRDRRYLDLVLGYGSVVLGHADPAVTESVIEAIRRGVSPTLRHGSQVELARLLTEVVPNAEAAMFFKTGSESTAAAVRLARAYTGRSVILRWGYQGWHDWCAPRPRGIPAEYRRLTVPLPFDDVDAVAGAFEAHRGAVAALVVMAMDERPPSAGYLQACRELADRHGAVLIFDEIRTGFRLALGGAQEYYGVPADLATFSKAMANGHPIAALTGRRELMRIVPEVSMSSLYSRSTDGIAAALATIRCLAGSDVIGRLWHLGSRLQAGMRAAAAAAGLPVTVLGVPPMPFHQFDLPDGARERAEDAFYHTVWDRGVLVHRSHHWFVCRDMTDADIDVAVTAIRAGYGAAAAACDT
jgi:glutamate-1-semialdehyde 2,1-aminomutase